LEGNPSVSHFTVVVITATPDEVEQVLAPYDENLEVPHTEYIDPDRLKRAREHYATHPKAGVDLADDVAVLRAWMEEEIQVEDGPDGTKLYSYQSTRNENAKWDWWQVGGRWGGFFQLKEGEKASAANAGEYEFEHHLNGAPIPDLKGKTDQARKRQIDFAAMRSEKAARAHADYVRFEATTKGLPIPRRWAEVLDLYGEDQVDLARKVYREQPFIRALDAAHIGPFGNDPVEHWCVTSGGRAAYVQRAADAAGVPFAVVADGVWRERGQMHWFAIVSDEMDATDWNQTGRKYYDQLPDDALLTCVDCHI
jgi:hypothetical protein